MAGHPYREHPPKEAREREPPGGPSALLPLAAMWIASAVRVAGSTWGGAPRGAAFDLAVLVLLLVPIAIAKDRTRSSH